jgi:hypothetical protein
MRIVGDFFRLYLFLLNLTFNIVFDKRRQYIFSYKTNMVR